MFGKLIQSLFRAGSAAYKSISAADAQAMLQSGKVFILDVRTAGEFAQGKIKGAKNIPLGDLPRRVGEIEKHKTSPVLVNCLSGGRSASACDFLASNGFSDVTNLRGGISAWMHGGYKTA